jgi:hypothetical protein
MTLADPAPTPDLTVFNLAHDHRPGRVVAPTDTAGVAAAVHDAALLGHTVHVIGTGHGLTAPITSGTALLTRGLASVTIDPEARRARIGAGATWQQVLDAAAPHGLAPVCGSAPGVGTVGFLLGGGLSPLGRSLGWGTDRVVSVELVTGAGEVVTATSSEHPDLFWALRGGKVAPGVVTAVEVDLLPITSIVAGGTWFGAEHAASVLDTYVAWSATLPDAVSTSVALLRMPDLDVVPPPLRGRFVVHVRVASVLAADVVDTLVAPMRAAAPAILDSIAEMPYAAIGAVHADPPGPLPALEAGLLLGQLDTESVGALLAAAGPETDAPFVAVELRHLGGALARRPAVPDSVVGRNAAYGLFAVSLPVPELFADVVPGATAGLLEAMAPWAADGLQPNFVGTLNGPDALDRAWPVEVRMRLDAVHEQYDTEGRFA